MNTTPRYRHVAYLAFKDLAYEWLLTLCFVIALCAVITPVLVLLGLKTGAFETWKKNLLMSPDALEVRFKHHTNLPESWFDDIRQHKETGFVVPSLFSASSTMTLKGKDNSLFIKSIKIVPTAKGDPLTGEQAIAPQTPDEIILTQEAAKKLQAKPNDMISALISRTYNGEGQYITHPMKLVHVIPETIYSTEAAFVSVSFITALESYKDGRMVEAFNVTQGQTKDPVFPPYPRARLYASSLDNVIPLAQIVSNLDENIHVTPRNAEIFRLEHTHEMISNIFNLIAVMAFLGILLSLSASLWANIDRKHNQLALLQLLGLRKRHMAIFPVIQACCISIMALLLSLGFYTLNTQWIDPLFAEYMDNDGAATQLFAQDFAYLSLILILVACFAALLGGYRATKIEPAEAMRGQ